MVLVSFAKKLLMWHEEQELAFQCWEKCLLALLLREKGLRYTPHISPLFGDFAVASTFYLPLSVLHFFFIFLFIPFVLLLLNTFLGHSCTGWQATFGSICSRIISRLNFSIVLCISSALLWEYYYIGGGEKMSVHSNMTQMDLFRCSGEWDP